MSRYARPNPVPLGIKLRSNLLQAPVFALGTVVFGSLALGVSLIEKSGRVQHRIARMWARFSVLASWTRVTVVNGENLRAQGPVVFAANHTSYMDTPVLFSSIPQQFRILAKIELWKLPFIGWYLNRSGQIAVDTSSAQATLSSLSSGVKALKSGMPLFVFPEGGRTPDGRLQPFLHGAAYLALRAQVPLVPIALVGVYDLLPMHTRHFVTRPVKLVAGKPIETKGRSVREVEALTAELKAVLAGMLEEYAESF